jgi:hypothetical protein
MSRRQRPGERYLGPHDRRHDSHQTRGASLSSSGNFNAAAWQSVSSEQPSPPEAPQSDRPSEQSSGTTIEVDRTNPSSNAQGKRPATAGPSGYNTRRRDPEGPFGVPITAQALDDLLLETREQARQEAL